MARVGVPVADRRYARLRLGSFGRDDRGYRPLRQPRRARPLQQTRPAPLAARTGRHRVGGAVGPPLQPHAVPGSCARRTPESTSSFPPTSCRACPPRRTGEVLPPLPGRPVPPSTAIPSSPSARRVPIPDDVVSVRRTGADALTRPGLVALGILPDGRKGIIGFQPTRFRYPTLDERKHMRRDRSGTTPGYDGKPRPSPAYALPVGAGDRSTASISARANRSISLALSPAARGTSQRLRNSPGSAPRS